MAQERGSEDIIRTAKGTVSNKSSALTLAVNSILLIPKSFLLVGLNYDDTAGPPVVKWGQRIVKPIETRTGNGITTRVCGMVYDGLEDRTRNLVATWTTTAPTAKVMFATMISGVSIVDIEVSQAEALTTDPDSGTAQLTNYDKEICIGVFGSEGPPVDAKGTILNGYSDGQRVGTSGAPPISNVTVHEVFKILGTAESTAAAKENATERDWCTVLVTFRYSKIMQVSISPTDLYKAIDWFEANNLSLENMVFFWNNSEDRWELYEVDLGTYGTFKAHQDNDWT